MFWLGIWCESLVWVIIGRRGVSQNAGILVSFISRVLEHIDGLYIFFASCRTQIFTVVSLIFVYVCCSPVLLLGMNLILCWSIFKHLNLFKKKHVLLCSHGFASIHIMHGFSMFVFCRLFVYTDGQYDVTYIYIKPLTHCGRDKMAPIFQTPFLNAFCWMKMYKFWWKFNRSLFPRAQLIIIQHWFR